MLGTLRTLRALTSSSRRRMPLTASPAMQKDSSAEPMHQGQVSPSNCVARMYLH